VAIRRKPGTDTEFPSQFAGNWLSVPGFASRDTLSPAEPVNDPPNLVRAGSFSLDRLLSHIEIRDETLSRLAKSQLTTSRQQLIFNYKVKFESMREAQLHQMRIRKEST
jgi:hypothetical protein